MKLPKCNKLSDDDKCQLIADLLADKGLREGEGSQLLVHAMLAPLKNRHGYSQEFVYVKPKSGDKERSYANGLRRMATEPGVTPGIADMYNRMADSWDAYADLPRWKKWLNKMANRLLGHGC
jgi:hypothetical protein